MTLYWDREGIVACPQHAPLHDQLLFRLQGWREITRGTVISGGLKCHTCAGIEIKRTKRHRAANDLYRHIHQQVARARGHSRRDPIEAPLFEKEQPNA
jgi:hypothetical protein